MNYKIQITKSITFDTTTFQNFKLKKYIIKEKIDIPGLGESTCSQESVIKEKSFFEIINSCKRFGILPKKKNSDIFINCLDHIKYLEKKQKDILLDLRTKYIYHFLSKIRLSNSATIPTKKTIAKIISKQNLALIQQWAQKQLDTKKFSQLLDIDHIKANKISLTKIVNLEKWDDIVVHKNLLFKEAFPDNILDNIRNKFNHGGLFVRNTVISIIKSLFHNKDISISKAGHNLLKVDFFKELVKCKLITNIPYEDFIKSTGNLVDEMKYQLSLGKKNFVIGCSANCLNHYEDQFLCYGFHTSHEKYYCPDDHSKDITAIYTKKITDISSPAIENNCANADIGNFDATKIESWKLLSVALKSNDNYKLAKVIDHSHANLLNDEIVAYIKDNICNTIMEQIHYEDIVVNDQLNE